MKTQESKIENGGRTARRVLECGGTTPLSSTRRVASNQSADMSAHSKIWRIFVAWLTFLGLALSVHAQNYSIDWHKIAGGGGTSTGSVYAVSGTIGQPDASTPLTGGNYSLTGGFWSLIAVVQTTGAPTLTITRSGNSVIVSWPSPSTGWALQKCGDLAAGGWGPSGYTVSDDGTNCRVTVSPPTGNLFFRLAK
jgi:hypothetical protein